MTTADSHHEFSRLPAIPEPWTARDTLLFCGIGVTIFLVMIGFMFSLSNM
jgi:hypothetical protein